jgi:hypothetical protein
MSRKFSLLAGFLLVILLWPLEPATAVAQGAGVAPMAGKVGPAVVLFDWKRDKCDHDDSPDEPPRAFRDRTGQVHLFATQFRNRQLVGPDFDHLRHPCAVVYIGRHSSNPAEYDDYGWLASFYTLDGQNIWAIVHNEFHGIDRPALCASHNNLRCLEASLVLAGSTNDGNTFTRLNPGPGVVAELPYRYQGDRKMQVGNYNPTNIIQMGSYFYAMYSMIDLVGNSGGVCIIRTNKLSDPNSWRAWDGHGYDIQFADPYIQNVSDPKQHVCTPIGTGKIFFSLGSVVLHRPSGLYLLSMRAQRWDAAKAGVKPGVYLSTSRDLINWSAPRLLLADTALGPSGAEGQSAEYYPSLMDPKSGGLNFTESSDRPYLFTIRTLPSFTTDNRQLIRRQVELPPLQ